MSGNASLVSLGEYVGIPLRPIEISTSEEAVNARVEELLAKVATPQPVDDAVRYGDVVSLSWDARVGKKGFAGSRGSSRNLEIGSGSFIPGFEDKLIGHRAGDDFEFSLNFPAIHLREELQGRLARMHVRIECVTRKPEETLTDEFVRSVSEFSGVEDLKSAIREQMEAENADEMGRHVREGALRVLADRTEADIPEELVEERASASLEDLRTSLEERGTDFAAWCRSQGGTEDEIAEMVRHDERIRIASSLALFEIARREGLQATEDDLADEARQLALLAEEPSDSLDAQVSAALEDGEMRSAMRDSVLREKALAFVVEHAVVSGEAVVEDAM